MLLSLKHNLQNEHMMFPSMHLSVDIENDLADACFKEQTLETAI